MVNLKNTIMKITIALLLIAISNILVAQNLCQSGDCINGYGKVTYGNYGVYVGNFINGKKNGEGMYAYMIGKDTSNVYRGNFKDDEFFGKGSFHVIPFCVYSSDSWTDSQNFTTGKEVRDDTKQTYDGAYVKLNFERSNTATTQAATNKTAIKILPPISYKTYIFKTQCSSRGKNFYVISKITADINRHPFDEIKYEATHLMSNNGWYAMSSTDYLGLEEDVKINGKPGKDYVVSGSGLYEFKKN